MKGFNFRSGGGRGAVVLLLFFLLVAPFVLFVHVFPLVNLPNYFVSAAAVVWGCVFFVIFNRRAVYLSKFSMVVLAFFVVLLISAYFGGSSGSDVRGLVVFGLVIFLAALLAAWLGLNVVGYYELVACVVLFGGVIQGVAAIALHYGLLNGSVGVWVAPSSYRMTGLLSQYNYLGIYVFCAFLSAGYLYLNERISLGLLSFFAVFFGFVLVGTGSRAIIAYAVASFAALTWCCRGGRSCFFGLILAFALLLVGGAGYWFVDGVVQPVLFDMGYVGRAAIGDVYRDYGAVGFRPSEWHKSWVMLLENPMFGVGFGRYAVESFWMGVEYPWAISEETLATHSHNLFTQLAAEFGLVGLISSVSLFFYVARKLLFLDKTPEWWFVVSVCGVFFVGSMLEYPLWDLHLAVFLVLLAAPLLSGRVCVQLSGFLVSIVSFLVVLFWGVVSLGAFDAYMRSLVYNSGVVDELGAYDLSVAGRDSFWGREINLLMLKHASPEVIGLDYYDKLTMEMMEWRPLVLVVVRRMHVAALKNEFPELLRLAGAMVKFYPGKVLEVRDFLVGQDGIKGTESERVIKDSLVVR